MRVKPSLTAMAHWVLCQPPFDPPQVYRWTAANNTKRPPSGKDRSKVKAARKQRNTK